MDFNIFRFCFIILLFQALVRMDKSIPYHQRMKRVEEVIQDVSKRLLRKI